MKIHPPPFELIYSMENLYHAWHKASLGKSSKSSIIHFYHNLNKNLESITFDLKNGSYRPGPYNRFLIKDPKERIISSSPVRDRVVQHAIMNYYDTIFDRNLIFDSYACRTGKGTHKAVLRAFHFLIRGSNWNNDAVNVRSRNTRTTATTTSASVLPAPSLTVMEFTVKQDASLEAF